MTTVQQDAMPVSRRTGQRTGYVIAIVVNLAMFIVVQNILSWGWLPFLNEDFADLVPLLTMSIAASIVANVIYLARDSQSVRSAGQIAVNLISLYVTYQIWQVFPFDFSGYAFDWAVVARVVLVLAMVGTGIGTVTEAVKLARAELDNEGR
jgi:hypothetical protein